MPGTEEWLKMRTSRHSAGRRLPGMEQSGCAGEGVAIAEQCEQVVTSEVRVCVGMRLKGEVGGWVDGV